MHEIHSIRSHYPCGVDRAHIKKRNIKDGLDVSAWRTPCVKEFYQNHCQLMVAERERVDRLTHKNQHAQGVPPSPYRNEGGRTSSPPKNYFFDVLVCKRSVKTD